MKKIIFVIVTVLYVANLSAQSVAINSDGSAADASAALEIKSTAKGLLVPRMTTAQRNAIAAPANGLLVFDNTTQSFWFKGNTNWIELVDTSNQTWKNAQNAGDIYRPYFSRVGINTNIPNYPLDVFGASFDNGIAMRLKNSTATVGERTSLLLSTSTQTGNRGAAAISAVSSVNSGQHLTFTTVPSGNQTASAAFERMRIDSAGNVGIGTTTAQEKLDVNGNIFFNGQLKNHLDNNINMAPIAFGLVNDNGISQEGTSNFTVVKQGTGKYLLTIQYPSGTTPSFFQPVLVVSGRANFPPDENDATYPAGKCKIFNCILQEKGSGYAAMLIYCTEPYTIVEWGDSNNPLAVTSVKFRTRYIDCGFNFVAYY